MAVRHGYGKIAGADALVFAYDTGDTKNSYKGRPTTNYGPASFGDWGTEASAERIATGNTYNGQPTYNCRTVVGESWRGIEKTISGLRTAAGSSGTVTMSCMVRNNNPAAYNMYAYIGHDFGSTRTIAANSDWQKVQWTVNQSSMNNDYVEFRPYTNNASVYLEMTMPMVEVNVTYASQFVNGTRSATQGLLNLTGNQSIDLTNAGFNSNAQLDFDGTNDVIYSPELPVLDSFSLEVVIKPDVLGGWILYRNSSMNYTGNADNFTFGISSSKLYGHVEYDPSGADVSVNSTTILTVDQYAHGLYTYDNASKTLKIYVNGVLEGTTVHTGDNYPYRSTKKMSIGADGGSNHGGVGGNKYFFNGEIPVVKAYNRALTAAEVKNNYNNYKSRFNI
jgi:hypothetical protein